jgi:DNA-binding MarR family transcriptional regulator
MVKSDSRASGGALGTSAVQEEIIQKRPFHSVAAEVAVSILRTAAVIERYFNKVTAPHGITIQQYNVLRILRGAGEEGLPTLAIRDRMVHEAPGITRLVDKLAQAGHVRRDRSSPDRRQVFCYITPKGLELLEALHASIEAADDASVAMLAEGDQRQLVQLLDAVREGHRGNVSRG